MGNKIDALKAIGRKIRDKAADKGYGVEHIAKPTGGGGYEHSIEIKFGKFGGIDIPTGKMEYIKPKEIQIEALKKKQSDPIVPAKPQMKQYGDKGYDPRSKSVTKNN